MPVRRWPQGEYVEKRPKLLDSPRPPRRAVTDKTGGLFIPFRVGVIEGVLQHGWNAVVVFGGNEDIAIETGDLLLPPLRNRILRRHPSIRRHLVEKRHGEIA